MPTPIAPDDLAPDLWITLRPVPEEEPLPPFMTEMHPAFLGRRPRPSRLRPGVPLRILAVDLPNVYVSILDPDGDEVGPLILDIGDQPVWRLDDAVPDAIRRFADMKLQQAQQSREEAACLEAEVEAAAKAARRRRLQAERDASAGPDDEPRERRRTGPSEIEPRIEKEIREAVQQDLAEMKRRRARRRRPGGENDGGQAA